jgi:hypothetical protein
MRPSRLRLGEWLAAVAAAALLALLVLAKWYGQASASVTGWHALAITRWLVLITAAVALVLAFFQAARRAPAIPVSISVILTLLSLIAFLALLYRVTINAPAPGHARVGAFLGLAGAAALVSGAYLSMRTEGIAERDGPGEIELVALSSGDPR